MPPWYVRAGTLGSADDRGGRRFQVSTAPTGTGSARPAASRHGIDDPEWAEDASDERRGRQPTAEQSAELERRLREIHGLDPETGLYRD